MIKKDNDGDVYIACGQCERPQAYFPKSKMTSTANGLFAGKDGTLTFTCNSCLEKAKEPVFKVGDRVLGKISQRYGTITAIDKSVELTVAVDDCRDSQAWEECNTELVQEPEKAKAPPPAKGFQRGDRVREKTDTSPGAKGTVSVVGDKKILVSWDGGSSGWWPAADYDLIQPKEAKVDKMWRVFDSESADQHYFAPSDTYLGAIKNFGPCARALGYGFDKMAREWQKYAAKGYKVVPFTPTPAIDWEQVIVECMGMEEWGSPAKCPFCVASEKIDGAKCGVCLFSKYLNDNPTAMLVWHRGRGKG